MKSLQIPSAEISDPEQMRCEKVKAFIQSRQRMLDVLYAFADGLSRQQVAEKLGLSIKTVDTYKTILLELCRIEWRIPLDKKINYRFLRAKFVKAKQMSQEGVQSTVQGEQDPTTEMLRQSELTIRERACCDQVIARASKSELRVLSAFADGLTPQQVAEELWISIKTVHSHKTKLLALCYSAWNLSRDERLDYHFLNERFASFSSHAKRETPDAIK